MCLHACASAEQRHHPPPRRLLVAQPRVERLQPLHQRPPPPRPHLAPIHLNHRDLPSKGACDKRLVCAVHLCAQERGRGHTAGGQAAAGPVAVRGALGHQSGAGPAPPPAAAVGTHAIPPARHACMQAVWIPAHPPLRPSAPPTLVREKSSSRAGMACARHSSSTLARVMPCSWYLVVGAHTCVGQWCMHACKVGGWVGGQGGVLSGSAQHAATRGAHATARTSPLRTTKKLVELQVATKPRGSSISASSAPALLACRVVGCGCTRGLGAGLGVF